MSETRRQVAWSAAGFLFPALAAIFLTPWVIRGLGDARYGLFLVAMTTIGFLSLLELGLASAAVHELATARQGKGAAPVPVVFWTVTAIFGGIGLISASGLFALHAWVVDAIFTIEPALRDDALFCVQLAALGLGTNLWIVPFVSWLRAIERFDLQSKVGIATNIVATLGSVWRGAAGDLQGAIWVQMGVSVVSLVMMAAIAVRLTPAELAPSRPSWAVASSLWRFAAYQMLSRLAGGVGQHVGKLVLAANLGAAQLAWFSTPFSMMQRVQGLLGSAAGIAFPQTARLSALGDDEAVCTSFRRGQKVLIPLAAAICLPFAFCAEPFLQAWISPEFAGHATLPLQVSALAFALSGPGIGYVNVLLGRGRSKAVFRLEVSHVLVHTALLWPLTDQLGAAGAALAYACGWVAIVVGEWAVRAELGAEASRGVGKVVVATLVASLLSGLAVAPLAPWMVRFGVLGPLACCGLATALTLGALVQVPGLFGEDQAIADDLRGLPGRLVARVRR